MINRRGTILIIVAGLAMMIFMLSVAFILKMRTDAEESVLVVRDAQARVMLVAALQYIQESSRLGWADPKTDVDGLSFGWTDVRDGGIGPRGPRQADGKLPIPVWWRADWPKYPDDSEIDPEKDPQNQYTYNENKDLPGTSDRIWPCPGSVLRADMYSEEVPPCAVQKTMTYNPVAADLADNPGPVLDQSRNFWELYSYQYYSLLPYFQKAKENGHGMLDPQPVKDTWNDFRAGNPTPRSASTGRCWFRIYRELPSNHNNDGDPWYDHVALKGNAVFIVACGSGGSRGYRFWNTSDAGFERGLEAQTAEESHLFPDEQFFRDVRQADRILWYRAEWTANQGGGANAINHFRQSGYQTEDNWDGLMTMGGGDRSAHIKGPQEENETDSINELPIDNQVVSFFGAIKWIQRLEKDPMTW